MLQQTQVATVLPYYERFLKRFPDIASLARAGQAEVLRFWAGLGYYSRARNLHKAAQLVMTKHAGRFPDALESVLDLPGIGRYTAGAILSIAFNRPLPVLDGNVMRVFARLFGVQGDVKSGKTQKELWSLAEELVNFSRPGDWNQALMELGALVCLPDSPRCDVCPLAESCVAYRKGLQDRLPQVRVSKKRVQLEWDCLWVELDGKILLHKRPESERFLPGHWGLPEARHLKTAAPGPLLATVRHTITYHQIRLHLRRAEAPSKGISSDFRWVPRPQLNRFLVSSVWIKALPLRQSKGLS